MNKYKYEIKVFNSDEVLFKNEQKYLELSDCIADVKIFNDKNSGDILISYWETMIDQFEGMNYCVVNIITSEIIISGSYDPNDIEIIEEYISNQQGE